MLLKPLPGIGRRCLAIAAELGAPRNGKHAGLPKQVRSLEMPFFFRVNGAFGACDPGELFLRLGSVAMPKTQNASRVSRFERATVSHDVISEPYRGWPQRQAMYGEFEHVGMLLYRIRHRPRSHLQGSWLVIQSRS